MDSRSAAHVLSEIADLLELRAENRFKTRAYRGAAKAVLALDTDDLTPLLRSGELAKVKGVGSATLAVITDLVENGESRYLEQLRMNVPDGLLELMRVPGLSPEKMQQISRHVRRRVASMTSRSPLATADSPRSKGSARRRSNAWPTPSRSSGGRTRSCYSRAPTPMPHSCSRRYAATRTSSRRRSRGPCVAAARSVRDIDIVAAVRGDPNGVAASFARVPGVVDASVAGRLRLHSLRGRHDARPVLRARRTISRWRSGARPGAQRTSHR